MPWITKEGRTVEEAKDAAVSESGLPASDLEIEVVNEGAKGLFGLGGEPAVVRVRAKSEAQDFRSAFRDDITPGTEAVRPEAEAVRPEAEAVRPEAEAVPAEGEEEEDRRPLEELQQQAAELGAEIVGGIIERMGLKGEINTRIAGGTVYIEVFGDEMGILIGRSGATLESLQEIVRAGIQRRLKTRQAVVVDVEGYWERRRGAQAERQGGRGRGGGGRRQGQRRRNGNRRNGNRRDGNG